jgi:hypothetical protein
MRFPSRSVLIKYMIMNMEFHTNERVVLDAFIIILKINLCAKACLLIIVQ